MPKANSHHHRTPTPAGGYSRVLMHAAGKAAGHVVNHGIKWAFGGKNKGSQTETKTKHSKQVREAGQHNDLKKAGDNIIIGKMSHESSARGRWKYLDQMQGAISAAEGKQGVNLIGVFCNAGLFTDVAVPSVAIGDSLKKLTVGVGAYSMNPFQKSTGNAQAGTGVILSDDRIVLEKISLSYSFANLSNINITGCIYFVTPKNSVYNEPLVSWDTVLSTQGFGTFGATASVQPSLAVPAVAGAYKKEIVGQHPFANASFCKQFALLKERPFTLSPGENLDYKAVLHYEKVFDKTTMSNIASSGGAGNGQGVIPGRTVYAFIIHRGSVVKDLVYAAGSGFSYGACNIAVINTAEYSFRGVPDIQERTQAALAVPLLYTGSSLANQQLINDVDVIDNIKQT